LQKKLGQIRTVLASHAGDYCPLKGHAASPSSWLCDNTPDRRHRTAIPCFLDLSLPIVSEHSALHALMQLLEEI
jgi:hypothetical protein